MKNIIVKFVKTVIAVAIALVLVAIIGIIITPKDDAETLMESINEQDQSYIIDGPSNCINA